VGGAEAAGPPEPPGAPGAREAPETREASGLAEVPGSPGPAPSEAAPAPPPDAPLAVVFDRLRAFAGRENRGLAAALAGGRLALRTAERLRIAAPSRFAAERLADRREALEATCARFFGRAMAVEIETPSDAPAKLARPEDREAARRLRERALEHAAVNAALEVLEAKILDIRPAPGVPRGS
jgi:hypothetical protein